MSQQIHTTKAPQAIGPYAQAVLSGDTLYISGQLPIIPETGELLKDDISRSTELIFMNVKEILHAAQMDLSHIVMVTIYMKDLSQFEEFNKRYSDFFEELKPARATVGVASLPKNSDLEVSVIARKTSM